MVQSDKIPVGSNINKNDEYIYHHLFHPAKYATTTTTKDNKKKNRINHQINIKIIPS